MFCLQACLFHVRAMCFRLLALPFYLPAVIKTITSNTYSVI